MDALDPVERDVFGLAIISLRGASKPMPRDPGRDLKVAAAAARRMGCYLITHTMARRHGLDMTSYDRLFARGCAGR